MSFIEGSMDPEITLYDTDPGTGIDTDRYVDPTSVDNEVLIDPVSGYSHTQQQDTEGEY